MKKLFVFLLALLLSCSAVFAGDIASLVNLGFSPDSAYFMFGYYGVDVSTSKPYAHIYIIDTAKNDFVPGGKFETSYAARMRTGNDASGAFFKLFAEAVPNAKKYAIDYLNQGRLIYLLVNGESGTDTLNFKDPDGSAEWSFSMNKTLTNADGSVASSFGITASVKKDGALRTIQVGNPHIVRKDVSDYVIRGVVLAPDGRTVILLIEKICKEPSGTAIRYMVETFRLP